MNSAINILYSIPQSIYQYRENLTINQNLFYTYHKQVSKDSICIELPDIKEIIILSNFILENSDYEIIADKQILGKINSIFVKKYTKIVIRVYNIKDYNSFKISFDVTLEKPSIKSCL
jgi:hypothetical protein